MNSHINLRQSQKLASMLVIKLICVNVVLSLLLNAYSRLRVICTQNMNRQRSIPKWTNFCRFWNRWRNEVMCCECWYIGELYERKLDDERVSYFQLIVAWQHGTLSRIAWLRLQSTQKQSDRPFRRAYIHLVIFTLIHTTRLLLFVIWTPSGHVSAITQNVSQCLCGIWFRRCILHYHHHHRQYLLYIWKPIWICFNSLDVSLSKLYWRQFTE